MIVDIGADGTDGALEVSTDVTVKLYERPGVKPVTTADVAVEPVSTTNGAPVCGVTFTR